MELSVAVDPRIELVGIIFMLAGECPEYFSRSPRYVELVQKHFTPYANLDAVVLARKLSQEKSVSFNAPASLAVNWVLTPEGPVLKPNALNIDKRWQGSEEAFTATARQFFRQAHFMEFFEEQASFYSMVQKRASDAFSMLRSEWFASYYGSKERPLFRIIPTPGNSTHNYGASSQTEDGVKEFFAVLSPSNIDEMGNPLFNAGRIPMVVHEFSHSYVNPLVDANLELFRESGEKFLDCARQKMQAAYYGLWPITVYETLVRGNTLRYTREHCSGGFDALLASDIRTGFVWMPQTVELLGEYEANRGKYPTFASFLPRAAEGLKEIAAALPKAPSSEAQGPAL